MRTFSEIREMVCMARGNAHEDLHIRAEVTNILILSVPAFLVAKIRVSCDD